MSNCLLKPSSAWFLRPKHLKPIPKEYDSCIPQPPKIQICLTPEEECCIREYCPVTLNHLLPDLQLTKKLCISKASEEFDTNLQFKFEEHLQQSHRLISCSSENETESDTENNIEECIENDLNFSDDNKENKSNSRMKLLLPNKINYPEDSMDSFLLPNITLNNNRASSPVFTKNFCSGCINENNRKNNSDQNMQLIYSTKRSKKYYSSSAIYYENLATSLPPVTNSNHSFKVHKSKPSRTSDNSYSKRYVCNEENDTDTNRHHRVFINSTGNKHSLLSKRRRKSTSPVREYCQREVSVPRTDEQSSFCILQRRSRSHSLMYAKKQPVFLPPSDSELQNLIPPSPHLLELARLKREKLKMDEKRLLKQRMALEIERLRPPKEKWYEMKDHRFHQEAHRNNVYMKNEKILPLVNERRRQLYESLMI